MRIERYAPSGKEGVVEVYRDESNNPRFRRESPPGTEVEDRAATPVEESRLEAYEDQSGLSDVRQAAARAIQELSGTAQGQAVLDLVIMLSHIGEPIPLKFARSNGWVPPQDRS